MECKKDGYFIDSEMVTISENYITVALKNLGYDLETILDITSEVDRLYEEEKPRRIERKSIDITRSVYGHKRIFVNQPYKIGTKYTKRVWWEKLKIVIETR